MKKILLASEVKVTPAIGREIKQYEILTLLHARGIGGANERRCLWSLCGKPMIQWVIESALGCPYLNKIVVATEDKEIALAAEKFGASAVIRPLETALDFPRDYTKGRFERLKPRSLIHASSSQPMNHHNYALYFLEEVEHYVPELLFSVSMDMPLATAESATKVIEAFFMDSEAYGSNSMVPDHRKYYTLNPITGRIFPVWQDAVQNIDRQEYPPLYTTGPHTLRGLPARALSGGRKVICVIVDEVEGVHVHEKEDLELAEFYMQKKRLKGGEKK